MLNILELFFLVPMADFILFSLQFFIISLESMIVCENILYLDVLCLSALSIAFKLVFSPVLYIELSLGRC